MYHLKPRCTVKQCLADYIRSHADAYGHLDGPKPARAHKKHKPAPAARQQKRTSASLANVPRWARVAFAARCARQVYPLLAEHWPGIPAKRSRAVRLAIDLAEQSAAAGRAVKGLKDAVMHALITAGSALRGAAERAGDKSAPPDAYSGTIASIVARVAAQAAESAASDGDDALEAASEAWSFAANAAASAEKENLAEQLKEDFAKLYRAAARGKWTDRTKIPSEVWSGEQSFTQVSGGKR